MVGQKNFKIIWDQEALKSLQEILAYLNKQSDQAPRLVKKSILQQLELIKKNPFLYEMDKLKDPPNRSFRAFIVFSFRISYQVKAENKQLRILRIRHTSQDPLMY